MIADWKPIKDAPKEPTYEYGATGIWILGANDTESRVIRWTTQYPCTEGCWMFAYEPTDYIDGIQIFHPTHWDYLPVLPKKGE